MQRQTSIFSFLRKPSSEAQRSGVPAPSCDASRLHIAARKDPDVCSSRPEALAVDPDPEIRGTDTPPEKPLRGLFRAAFPTSESGSDDGRAARPLASIMRRFVKEEKNLEAGNQDHLSPSKSGCSDINHVHKKTKYFLQEKQKATISSLTDYNDVDDLEVDTDVLGPETPAMRPLVPRLKRVQEDYSKCDNKYSSLLGSGKRLKSILQSNKEKKTHEEAHESSRSKFEWLNPLNIKDAKGRSPDDPLYDKNTLFIPPDALKKMSASQRQYWSVKCQYMDVVLFFKVGKFYELYELDAEIGQKELDWKMTISGVGKCRQVGISEFGIDDAVQKLTERGYKVGRMEQMETSDQAKARGTTSVIQRKLVNISTPSTLVDGGIGQEAVHLLALKEGNSGSENGPTVYGFAFLDHAALKFWVGSIEDNDSCAALGTLLMQISPREIIYEQSGLSTKTHMTVKKYTSAGSIKTQMTSATPSEIFLDASDVTKLIRSKGYFKGTYNSWSSVFDYSTNHDLVVCALGGLIHHLSRLMLEDSVLNGELLSYHVYKSCLRMDGQTLINLEIFNNNYDSGLSGTLYKYLDHCITASGKRLLRRWICHPLKGIGDINDRLDIVEGLVNNSEVISIINGHLRRVPDLERLLGRVRSTLGSSSTLLLPFVGERVLKRRINTFGTLVKGLRTGIDLVNVLMREDHGVLSTSKYANIPKISGLDELLRQFEVALDDDFPQYQNHNVQESDAQTLAVLAELFAEKSTEWSQVIDALNCIDVLQSFAVAAISSCRSMSRPVLVTADSNFTNLSRENAGPILRMKGLWHPYASVGNENDLVPNDINLGEDATGRHPCAMLLTGPNMGGKSTLMRASCLAVILAQLGCYVPCETCILSPVDTIFTRLGATDRIMSGESTFYVECSETASILQDATRHSLVLLDELGRGTSTFDGYAIAYAVFRHLVEAIRCRMLFATHYHPLTKEFESHPQVTLQHMACAFQPRNGLCYNKELIFLYRLTAGACPESYGLQVALHAGIPETVVKAASKASQKMKLNICKHFNSSEERSQFSTLHEEWLKTLLGVSSLTSSSWNEDTCDTLLCVWHELKSVHKSG